MRVLFFLFCFLVAFNSFSQSFVLKGQVKDAEDKSSLPGVLVLALQVQDTLKVTSAITDVEGNFLLELPQSEYKVRFKLMGYNTHESFVRLTSDINLGSISLTRGSRLLKEVNIETKISRFEQKGDTSQYNAGAYKVNPDATTEDLIKKMPGMTSENGVVKVNGEEIKQIRVDGKAFFGDDVSTAIKNLPAEIVDKIQVYDKMSDQAQFTKFDDGNSAKTLNIVTKSSKSSGQFGKVYGGYGTEDRYIGGGNVNIFKETKRISIIGLSNNINQQNFNSQDVQAITGSSGGQRWGGSPMMRGGRGRGSDAGNLNINPQGGITSTHSFAVNHSDNWSKNLKVSGSYFFNYSDNDNETSLTREYFSSTVTGRFYDEKNVASKIVSNHKFNYKIEWNIDTLNSITYTPKFNISTTKSNSFVLANTLTEEKSLLSNSLYETGSNAPSWLINNNLLLQHKFKKTGRTISLNLANDINLRENDDELNSVSGYLFPLDSTYVINQFTNQKTNAVNYSSSLNYTEPVGKSSQVQLAYSPSLTENLSDKMTSRLFNGTQFIDTSLSNKFDNNYFSQKASVSYRINKEKLSGNIEMAFQHSSLNSERLYPSFQSTRRNFYNLVPNGMINYKLSAVNNIRLMYRTSINAPSVSQLQDVIDNSNPLILRAGNPKLKQDFNQFIMLRFGKSNMEKATGFFAFFMCNLISDYISSNTVFPVRDSVLANGVLLLRGNQLIVPVNLSGYKMFRGFITYVQPLTKIKSNLNFSTALNYSQIPSLINSVKNFANNSSISETVSLTSNISERLDFNLGYTGSYNLVKNTLQKSSDNSYYSQVLSFAGNWIFYQDFFTNLNYSQNLYSGLSQGFNQQYNIVNAFIGNKFLKNKSLEVKLGVADLFNQNKTITRNVTDSYLEDSRTNALTRYYLLVVTYSLRKFKAE